MKGRPVRKFAYGGQEYSLYGLSVKFGIKLSTLESRVYGRKMTIEDAIAMGPADVHRERKQHLMSILADREEAELRGKSSEELMKMIADLEG